MGILGIRNRTENWKTAESFAPFFECDSARTRLANRLLQPLEKSHKVQPCTVKIELFWYGMRDYMKLRDFENMQELTPLCLTERYNYRFRTLGERIRGAEDLNLRFSNDQNYNPEIQPESLHDNLRNTEIDIVLETPKYLFIGEAKHQSDLGTNGELVLVHQLIRQYVMAKILVDLCEPYDCRKKEVIPFIVADKSKRMKSKHQVRFMRDHECWLHEKNILSWNCIDKIAESTSTAS